MDRQIDVDTCVYIYAQMRHLPILVGGLEHFCHFIYGISSFDEFIFFKVLIAPPTRLLWYNIHHLWLI